ncbi:hypothetical protein F4820DRAFT_445392 [Hypoxylon rubiginosum]|uniref:Uncharacterized protein n=1 Tax=Hypoxylon rubiginosum TaxID=110542 RepID=A0ACB9Z9E0_9PEZI|nr:hypothetical protein F4820DRAFT_445392 [Hypoxylon rubiginosum]
MDGLSDLREMYPGDEGLQNYRLQNQFPPLYRPRKIPGIPADDMAESSGLGVLLVVIRRLCSHLRGPFRDAKLDDAIRQQEQINPLLRLAMCDFGSADMDTIYAAMYHSLKAFYPDGVLSGEDLSFDSLVEHALMRTTLWQRAPFLRLNPKTVVKKQDETSLGIIHIADIVRWSLFSFRDGDLGAALSDNWGWWKSAGDQEFAVHYGAPAILRVHYTVDAADPKKFRDLRRITVDQMRMMAEETPAGLGRWKWSDPGSHLTSYTLIAVVRLAADSKDPKLRDTVRTYTLDGHVIPAAALGFPAMRATEVLGEPNAVYYLYYGLWPQVTAPEPTHLEIRGMPDGMTAGKLEKAVNNVVFRPSTESMRLSGEGIRSKYFNPPQDNRRDNRRDDSRGDSGSGSYRDRGYGPLPEYEPRHFDRHSSRRNHPSQGRDRHSGGRGGERESGSLTHYGRGRHEFNRGLSRGSGSEGRRVLPLYPAAPPMSALPLSAPPTSTPPPPYQPPAQTGGRRQVANRNPGRDRDTKEARIQKC